MKPKTKEEREKKIICFLEKAVDKNRGNRIRQVMISIAKAYDDNPEKLKGYFNHKNQLLIGIATSAYHFLTGDIRPIQTREWGGLGAIINDSEEELKFGRCQLNFSKNSGNALKFSENDCAAMGYSENSGNALKYSKNTDGALSYSKNSGHSLANSENSRFALGHSENTDHALGFSKNSDGALLLSKNSVSVLKWIDLSHLGNNPNS